MAVVIGVLRETAANETRVAVVPKSAIAAAILKSGDVLLPTIRCSVSS